jgi:hypothetical protein
MLHPTEVTEYTNLCSLFNIAVKLGPSHIALLNQFSNVYLPPIPANKSRISGLASWRMIEKFLDCCLSKGRMALGS